MTPGWFRFFLAVVVVFYHTSRFVFFGYAAVFTFFILSGYWITEMYREKYAKLKNPWLAFATSRILRIFPTFFACSAIAFLLISLRLGNLDPEILNSWFWVTRSLALLGSSALGYRLIETQWSLDIEIQYYLLFPLIYATFKKRGITYAVFLVLLLLTMAVGLGLKHSIVVYLPFFVMGMIISEMRLKFSEIIVWISSSLACTLVVLAFLVTELRASLFSSGKLIYDGYDVTHFFDTAMAVLAVPFVSRNVRCKDTRLGAHAGNLSFPLYMVHWVLLGPYILWYGNLSVRERLPYFGGYLFASLIGSVVLYVAVDRPVDLWRKRIVANRVKRNELAQT